MELCQLGRYYDIDTLQRQCMLQLEWNCNVPHPHHDVEQVLALGYPRKVDFLAAGMELNALLALDVNLFYLVGAGFKLTEIIPMNTRDDVAWQMDESEVPSGWDVSLSSRTDDEESESEGGDGGYTKTLARRDLRILGVCTTMEEWRDIEIPIATLKRFFNWHRRDLIAAGYSVGDFSSKRQRLLDGEGH